MASEAKPPGRYDRARALADSVNHFGYIAGCGDLDDVRSAWQAVEAALVGTRRRKTDNDDVDNWTAKAAEFAKRFRAALRKEGGELNVFRKYGDNFSKLAEASYFLFAELSYDEPTVEAPVEPPQFTLLDRYPDSPEGHIAYLEFFASELRFAAKAKASGEYPNDTITRALQLKNWEETKRRMESPGLPEGAVESVRDVLRIPLAHTNVELVAKLLTPAVERLRVEYQESLASPTATASEPVQVMETLAGDDPSDSLRASDFIAKLLAGPEDEELTARELAFLEAYLKRPYSLLEIQRERRAMDGSSPTWERRAKLKSIRDFNHKLLKESSSATSGNATEAGFPSPPRRRYPSEGLPKSIAEGLRIARLAKLMFPDGLKIIGAEPHGPCYLEMLGFLRWYVGTPHERIVWDVYHEWFPQSDEDLLVIDEAAAEEGMTREEFISRATLAELRRFIRANGIPAPPLPDGRPVASPGADSAGVNTPEPKAGGTEEPSRRIEKLKHGAKVRRKIGTGRPTKYDISFVAALTSHHGYENGYCGVFEPIDNSSLRKAADDCPANAVTRFFDREFKGAGTPRKRYVAACRNKATLIAALMRLNQESPSAELLGIDLEQLRRDDD